MTRKAIAELTPERLLMLHIAAERYPAAIPIADLKARFVELIREYGTAENAVAAMREKRRGRA